MDFHREWVDLGLIRPQDFNINLCQSPEWYRIDILPEEFKQRVVIPALERHIAWLDPIDKLKRATMGYRTLINFVMANDASDLLPRFRQEIALLDSARNENFWTVFPELNELA
jgi:hypothetical protein